MQQNRVVCVDIGSDSIKVVVGMKSSEGLELLEKTSVPTKGIAFGVVTDVEKCSQSLKQAFANVKVRENDFIVVGLSSYYVESTKSEQSKFIREGARVCEADMDELFEKAENAYLKEDLKQLDVCLQFYNVDNIRGIQNPAGMSGVKLEATYRIFSCRKTFLGSLEECINLAGFQVGRFTFSSSYLADLLIDEDDKEIQTLILDLGADATRVSLFEEGALLTSFALPFGGRSITMDIKNSYGIAFQQAEKLKKKFSCALAKEADEDIEILFDSKEGKERSWSLRVVELAGVLQCRLDEIFTGIRYQLVKLSLSDSIEKVLFIGGGTNHKQMKEYLENQFNVPAQKAVLRNDVFLNVNTAEFETWKYANVLGMLAFYLQELVMEETEEVSIFQKISTGFRSFFGGKSAGKDTQM